MKSFLFNKLDCGGLSCYLARLSMISGYQPKHHNPEDELDTAYWRGPAFNAFCFLTESNRVSMDEEIFWGIREYLIPKLTNVGSFVKTEISVSHSECLLSVSISPFFPR